MKTIQLFFTLAILLISFNLKAAVITVDNNPGAVADHTTLAAAITAAVAYDTIYIAGSPYYYDGSTSIRINKKGLVLIGPGYYLGNNPKTQASNNDARIYQLEIGQGGDSCVIMGLNFATSGQITYLSDDLSNGNDGTLGPQGVIFRRNIIYQIRLGAGSSDNTIAGTVIEQNMFPSNTQGVYIYTSGVTNVTINNNIFKATSSQNIYSYAGHTLSSTVINNNVFSDNLQYINGAEIFNNIFRAAAYIDDCDNNDVYNNVFVEASEESGTSTGNNLSNNLLGQLPTGLFVNDSPVYDADFQLGASSPALGAGVEGTDAGAFDGNSYVLSGIPSIPAIYELKTIGYGNATDGMNVTIKVKSNQ